MLRPVPISIVCTGNQLRNLGDRALRHRLPLIVAYHFNQKDMAHTKSARRLVVIVTEKAVWRADFQRQYHVKLCNTKSLPLIRCPDPPLPQAAHCFVDLKQKQRPEMTRWNSLPRIDESEAWCEDPYPITFQSIQPISLSGMIIGLYMSLRQSLFIPVLLCHNREYRKNLNFRILLLKFFRFSLGAYLSIILFL